MLTDSVCLLSHRREIVTQRRDFILKRLLLWKTALDLSNSKLASGELYNPFYTERGLENICSITFVEIAFEENNSNREQ